MKLKNRKPTDPEVTEQILQRIEQMTQEEILAFLTYQSPGIEETDMTGMFSNSVEPKQRPKTLIAAEHRRTL